MSLIGKIKAYKKSAKKRQITFLLTDQECGMFYKKYCTYCGNLMDTLGIDRVDNSKGYELDNCVPCCTVCNMMKHTSTSDQFKNQIVKIYNNINNVQGSKWRSD